MTIAEKFLYHKFGDLDLDSALGSQMREKLKNYLLMELERPDLFLNRKYDAPSQSKFLGILDQQNMKEHLQTIMTLSYYDMEGPSSLEKDHPVYENEESDIENDNQRQITDDTGIAGSSVNQVAVDSLDKTLNNIEAGLQSLSKQHLKLFDSFLALRENYFKLNNLQRDWLIKNNPELLLEIITLEETLIKLGVVLPTEADFTLNRANYLSFDIENAEPHKKLKADEKFGGVTPGQIENVKIKNTLLFKGFASRLGIDVELAEKAIHLAEQSREISKQSQFGKKNSNDMNNLMSEMKRSSRIQSMMSLSAYLAFLELSFGDTIDPDQNYSKSDFGTLFNFEKSMKFWCDENNSAQNFLYSNQNYDIVDSDHDKIARFFIFISRIIGFRIYKKIILTHCKALQFLFAFYHILINSDIIL